MGIFSRFFKTRAEPAAGCFLGNDASEILRVNGYVRLSDNPEVRTCVGRIAELVSTMTIHLMENGEKGDKRVVNELAKKIDVAPCSLMTRKTWMFNIVHTMLLEGSGNAVVYPVFDGDRIKDLMPWAPSKVSFSCDETDYRIIYKGLDYHPDEVLHFVHSPDPEKPFVGRGYQVILGDVVKTLKQASVTKNAFMSGKWKPPLIISVDANADELASETGRDKILNQYLANSTEGKPWVIPGGMIDVKTVTPLSIRDLAIQEGITLDKQTIAGLLGVPAFFLGVGSYSENEYNSFINAKILPIAKGIEQELTKKLLISPTLYFRFNPRTLYNYSLKDLVDSGVELVDRMSMRRNELRDWIGLSPDEEMDELLALENYLPVSELKNQKKLKKQLEGGGKDET